MGMNKAAKSLVKNNHTYHLKNAKRLFKAGKYEEAQNHYKKALEICINKEGKEHLQTAYIYYEYGKCSSFSGEYDKAKSYYTKAYRIFKKNKGEEYLDAVRILGHLSNLELIKKEYDSAFKKIHKAFLIFSKIKGDKNIETKICKNNCGIALAMLKQYDEAIDYLTFPTALVSKKGGIFLLLDYEKSFMDAPQLIISQQSVSIKKMLKIAESKNIPIIENHSLAKRLMKDCEQFRPVLPKYYERVAKMFARVIRKK